MECGESGGGGPKRYSAVIPLSVSAPKRSIEKEVRSMEPFRKLCETAEPRLGRVAVAISVRWRESSPFASECLYRARRFKHHCDPGISMVNVMYPFSVPDGVDARFWDRTNLYRPYLGLSCNCNRLIVCAPYQESTSTGLARLRCCRWRCHWLNRHKRLIRASSETGFLRCDSNPLRSD